MINRVLAAVLLTVGPVGPGAHPEVNSSVLEYHIGIHILEVGSIGSLACGMKSILVGKARGKPLEVASAKENSESKPV